MNKQTYLESANAKEERYCHTMSILAAFLGVFYLINDFHPVFTHLFFLWQDKIAFISGILLVQTVNKTGVYH